MEPLEFFSARNISKSVADHVYTQRVPARRFRRRRRDPHGATLRE